MRKKLIITENQLKMLTSVLAEGNHYNNVVNKIAEDLTKNYRKAVEHYRDGNEYRTRDVFEIIIDGQLISPEKLLEYFKLKYNYGENFLKQVIQDWCDDKIKDGFLSKNIGLKE